MSRRQKLLVLLELVLGAAYVASFAYFATTSRDFIVARDNGRAESAARAGAVPVPGTVEFGAGHDGNELLGAGWWSWTESSTGVWSRARAFLMLPVPAGTGDLELELGGTPFLADGHPDALTVVSVDGVELGRWHEQLGAPVERTVTVPEAYAADGVLVLRLEVPTAAVPERYGLGDDDREVGFLLRSIELR